MTSVREQAPEPSQWDEHARWLVVLLQAAWHAVDEYRDGCPEWLEHAAATAAPKVMAAIDGIQEAIDENTDAEEATTT